ncbi:MAG: transglycosylase domain-containing protein [Acidobacteria bacterium]|nr:transglycosylase domain-containing protein [Acidobacteriota bacterium]MCG3194406.1 Monofunctional biosynthetic peptidoglycan transglycosylase [Thermoanaerobaculia bacterium]
MDRETRPGLGGRLGPALLFLSSLLLLGTLAFAFIQGPRLVEARIRERLMQAAARAGVELRVGVIRFRWRGPLELQELEVRRAPVAVSIRTLRVEWSLQGEKLLDRIRGFAYEGLRVGLPSGISVESGKAEWEVRDLNHRGVRLVRAGTAEHLAVERQGGNALRLTAAGLQIAPWLRIRRGGHDVVKKGRFSGVAELGVKEGSRQANVVLHADGVEFPDIESLRHGLKPMAPEWLELAFEGTSRTGSMEFPCLSLRAPGLSVDGRGRFLFEEGEVWIEGVVDAASANLTTLLALTGVEPPEALRSVSDLGSARFSGQIQGSLTRPDSWTVTHRLEFDPPSGAVDALARYRGPFVQTVEWPKGQEYRFPVSAGSPTFIAFDDVPPLFIRSLLIAEDSSFFSHPGIDLEAIPVALSLNLTRGGPPRGASTITQQTAKNLFLRKERTLRRKLQELCLALLLEKSLSKRRILEIYLNIIEWGPGVYGLRRASRHYFGKEPRELSPREISFLVTLIPGPVKYQPAFASGIPSARFSAMVDRLLYKLGSVGALSEEELAASLSEQLVIGQGSGQPALPPAYDEAERSGGESVERQD